MAVGFNHNLQTTRNGLIVPKLGENLRTWKTIHKSQGWIDNFWFQKRLSGLIGDGYFPPYNPFAIYIRSWNTRFLSLAIHLVSSTFKFEDFSEEFVLCGTEFLEDSFYISIILPTSSLKLTTIVPIYLCILLISVMQETLSVTLYIE